MKIAFILKIPAEDDMIFTEKEALGKYLLDRWGDYTITGSPLVVQRVLINNLTIAAIYAAALNIEKV